MLEGLLGRAAHLLRKLGRRHRAARLVLEDAPVHLVEAAPLRALGPLAKHPPPHRRGHDAPRATRQLRRRLRRQVAPLRQHAAHRELGGLARVVRRRREELVLHVPRHAAHVGGVPARRRGGAARQRALQQLLPFRIRQLGHLRGRDRGRRRAHVAARLAPYPLGARLERARHGEGLGRHGRQPRAAWQRHERRGALGDPAAPAVALARDPLAPRRLPLGLHRLQHPHDGRARRVVRAAVGPHPQHIGAAALRPRLDVAAAAEAVGAAAELLGHGAQVHRLGDARAVVGEDGRVHRRAEGRRVRVRRQPREDGGAAAEQAVDLVGQQPVRLDVQRLAALVRVAHRRVHLARRHRRRRRRAQRSARRLARRLRGRTVAARAAVARAFAVGRRRRAPRRAASLCLRQRGRLRRCQRGCRRRPLCTRTGRRARRCGRRHVRCTLEQLGRWRRLRRRRRPCRR